MSCKYFQHLVVTPQKNRALRLSYSLARDILQLAAQTEHEGKDALIDYAVISKFDPP